MVGQCISHKIFSCSGDVEVSFSCLPKEDNMLWVVGDRIEPSCSQRPGFPSLPLPRQRFEEINTLALAQIQARDWINYRIRWAAVHSHGVALKYPSIPPPIRLEPIQLSQRWMLYFYLLSHFSQAHANVGDKEYQVIFVWRLVGKLVYIFCLICPQGVCCALDFVLVSQNIW